MSEIMAQSIKELVADCYCWETFEGLSDISRKALVTLINGLLGSAVEEQ